MKRDCRGKLVAADGDPDLGTLTAFGQRVFSFDYDGGDIEVKIFSVRDPDAVVRLYNEVPFESGRNVICRT